MKNGIFLTFRILNIYLPAMTFSVSCDAMNEEGGRPPHTERSEAGMAVEAASSRRDSNRTGSERVKWPPE